MIFLGNHKKTGTKPKIANKEYLIAPGRRIKREKDSDEEDENRGRGRKERSQVCPVSPELCKVCISDDVPPNYATKLLTEHEIQILKMHKDVQSVSLICEQHYKDIFVFFPQKHSHKCCDPLNRHGKVVKNNLFTIDLQLAQEINFYGKVERKVLPYQRICSKFANSCHTMLMKNIKDERDRIEHDEAMEVDPGPSASQTSNFSDTSAASGVKSKKEELLKKNLDKVSEDLDEIVTLIRTKWTTFDQKQRIAVLSILPSDWSCNKVALATGAERYLVNKARDGENPFDGNRKERLDKIPDDVIEIIREFYYQEDISRMMPGAGDFITVKIDGVKERLRRYHLRYRLVDIHRKFLEHYAPITISFSKFAKLRPQNCIMMNSKGCHNVCTCQACENPRLKIKTSLLGDVEALKEIVGECSDMECEEILERFCCDIEDEECMLAGKNCDDCFDTVTNMVEKIQDVLNSMEIQHLTYAQWLNTDYSTQQTVTEEVETFLKNFATTLFDLKKHYFFQKHQSAMFQYLKKNLPDGHVLVLFDFSENYVFKTQDSVQASYFINRQCSLFPVCIYTNLSDKPQSLAFVTPSNNHDTTAVWTFTKRINEFLDAQESTASRTMMEYFSDGAPAHFKGHLHKVKCTIIQFNQSNQLDLIIVATLVWKYNHHQAKLFL